MQTLVTVLVFGSLWGIAESTLGFFLHLVPGTLSGAIMFPIGLFFMTSSYERSRDVNVVFYVALLTAGIKSVNFLIPGANVVNPMLGIVAEGAIVFAVLPFVAHFKETGKLDLNFANISFIAVTSSLLWRISFAGFMFFAERTSKSIASVQGLMNFVVVDGLISAGIIVLGFGLIKLISSRAQISLPKLVYSLPLATALLVVSVGSEYLFNVI